MNAPGKIETGTMTSKGQVLIPKWIRDAAGLVPGQPYRAVLNDVGRVEIAPLGFSPEEADARKARVTAALEMVAGKYPDPDGRSVDAVMRDMRGAFEP